MQNHINVLNVEMPQYADILARNIFVLSQTESATCALRETLMDFNTLPYGTISILNWTQTRMHTQKTHSLLESIFLGAPYKKNGSV